MANKTWREANRSLADLTAKVANLISGIIPEDHHQDKKNLIEVARQKLLLEGQALELAHQIKEHQKVLNKAKLNSETLWCELESFI